MNDPRFVHIENFNFKMNFHQLKNLKIESRGIDEIVLYVNDININEFKPVETSTHVTLKVQGLNKKGHQIYYKEYGVEVVPNPKYTEGDKDALIVLEIGHGTGTDKGAYCRRTGRNEHELNIIAADAAEKQLRSLGFKNVIVTDDKDSLWNIGFKYGKKADVFVSVHHNAFNTTVQGSECLYSPKGNESDKRLAELIAKHCSDKLDIPNRGAVKMRLSVLSGTTYARMTEQDENGLDGCVLSEGYFMTAHDVSSHTKWSTIYGVALATAIESFLSDNK